MMKIVFFILFFLNLLAISSAQTKSIKWEMEFVYDVEDGKLDSQSVVKIYRDYDERGNQITYIESCRFSLDCENGNDFKTKNVWTYDSLDREISFEEYNKDQAYAQVYHYFNNEKGHLTKKVTIQSGGTSFEESKSYLFYDDKNNKIKSIDTNYYTNDTSVFILYFIYDKKGNLIEEKDEELLPIGHKVKYKYDKNNRKIAYDDESFGCGHRVSAYRCKYDKKGNKIQEKNKYMNVWSTHDFIYNDKNLLISELSYNEKNPKLSITHYVYDENDNVIKRESYNPEGELKSVTVYEYGYY